MWLVIVHYTQGQYVPWTPPLQTLPKAGERIHDGKGIGEEAQNATLKHI